MKSALLSACSASRTNAPIAVPLRRTCLNKTNSFRPLKIFRKLDHPKRKSKRLVFDGILLHFQLSILHSAFDDVLFHSQLSIINFEFWFPPLPTTRAIPGKQPRQIFHSPFPLSTEFCL